MKQVIVGQIKLHEVLTAGCHVVYIPWALIAITEGRRSTWVPIGVSPVAQLPDII